MYPIPAPGPRAHPPGQPDGIPPLQPQPGPAAGGAPAIPGGAAVPPVDPNAPRMRAVDEGPRTRVIAVVGGKRAREEESEAEISSQPALKQARTETAEPPVNPALMAAFHAIDEGDKEKVQSLLTQFPALINARHPKSAGETLLCRAAGKGNVAMVSLLIRGGGGVNDCANTGALPLMFAARTGHTEVIRELIRHGADLNAFLYLPDRLSPGLPFSSLCFAIRGRHLEACKCLIESGADFQQVMRGRDEYAERGQTPLIGAIAGGYTELIGWLLDSGRLQLESIEPVTRMTLVYAAARLGSLPMVSYLAARGANQFAIWIDPNGQKLTSVWMMAAFFGKGNVIEGLLSEGLTFPRISQADFRAGTSQFVRNAWDLSVHRNALLSAHHVNPDGLMLFSLKQQPEWALEVFSSGLYSGRLPTAHLACQQWWSTGLISEFIQALVFNADHLEPVIKRLCGKLFDTKGSASVHLGHLGQRQRLHIVLEMVSDACCNPALPTLFSGMQLSKQGEAVMNQMVVLQRDLLLEGIARLRARFDQQVASLPDLCMKHAISPLHRLNEADLYHALTEDWGLYDPIARAVLRLVQEAHNRLQRMKPEEPSASFVALSPAEQLKAMIVDVLEKWDKIPEIVEAIGGSKSPEEMDLVSDLLFQQWRLFCEALGVTKERYLSIGPRRREEVGVNQTTVTD